jgi:hypothetical protein
VFITDGKMIIIYNCYGGTHSSSLASAIHLKKLPSDRVPTREEILNTDYFNRLTYRDMGKLIYRGTDDEDNKIFSLGRGTSKVLIPCLENLIKILHNDCGLKEKIVMSNMSPAVPIAMTFGGFFSRGLGLHFIGVPLLVIGAKQTYKHIVELVEKTKEAARTLNEVVLVLNNDK